nr:RNA-directed DNA polymerase, eukaryota [Tanacetum cinerariifolium]
MNDTTTKVLWRLCKQYGNVIDVFIPNTRSKLGKRFGFVRFIKILDIVRLVNNLCTIWIGKFKLHVNIARFNRPLLNKGSHSFNPSANVKPASDASYKKVESRPSSSYIQAAKVGISSLSDAKALKPASVLDDSFAHKPDLVLSLVASNSFSVDERVVWIDVEGIPLCAKRLCIKTSFQDIIFTSQKIIVKGKVFLIRVKELTGWALSFNDDSDYDDESVDSQEASILKDEFSDKNSDMEEISETVLDKSEHVGNISPACNEVRMETRVEEKSKDPFNIYDTLNKKKPIKSIEHSDSNIQYPPGFTPSDRPQVNSNLDHINQTKVLDKEPGAKASFQEDVNVLHCSRHFQSVKAPKLGGNENREGGILCIWDPNLFYKENSTVSDYFIAIIGNWLPNNKKWNGEVLLLEDFNEVRLEEERYGSIFNSRRAAAFIRSLLIVVWWKYLLVVSPLHGRIGKRASASNLKKDLKNKLSNINSVIDKGKVSSAILEDHLDTINKLASLENMESSELAQKAKVKWSIKGDENSKFFHGIINKRRNNLAIRGIMVDGDWMEDPAAVKRECFSYFQNRFEAPCATRLFIDMEFPNRLSFDQALDLERHFFKEEIKGAVWDCGLDKSSGPDGFTFGFYRRYWSLLEDEVVGVVNHFYNNGFCHKGGNSSFIALIPKTQGAKLVKDFRPISLIGSLYKIITKLLANSLVTLIGNLVNDVQFAFIANRQILDGPFILNELIHWCKAKKKETMIFKGDPLLPFLFVLVMDTLHLSFQNVVNAGLFKGVVLNNSLQLSHLFYADDAIFIGVVVENSLVTSAANNIRCMTLSLPFSYLGVNVGGHMSSIASWDVVINKVLSRLSKWKMKVLSVGCVDLLGSIKKKVGNGENTMFWDALWKGEVLFKNLFPRLYALESVKNISVADKMAQPSLEYSFRRNIRGGAEQV